MYEMFLEKFRVPGDMYEVFLEKFRVPGGGPDQ